MDDVAFVGRRISSIRAIRVLVSDESHLAINQFSINQSPHRSTFLPAPRSTSLILDVASIALLGGVAWVGYWASSALPTSQTPGKPSLADAVSTVPGPTRRDQIEIDPALIARPLRGPLVDLPKVVAAPKPRPKPRVSTPKPKPKPVLPRLDLSLVGTMLSDSGNVAILSNPQGEFDVKGVGEVLDLQPAGITLMTIEATAVTVEYQGDEIKLEVDKSTSGSTPPARRRR